MFAHVMLIGGIARGEASGAVTLILFDIRLPLTQHLVLSGRRGDAACTQRRLPLGRRRIRGACFIGDRGECGRIGTPQIRQGACRLQRAASRSSG